MASRTGMLVSTVTRKNVNKARPGGKANFLFFATRCTAATTSVNIRIAFSSTVRIVLPFNLESSQQIINIWVMEKEFEEFFIPVVQSPQP